MSYGAERQYGAHGALGGVGEGWHVEPPFADSIIDMRFDPLGYWLNMPGFVRVDDDSIGIQEATLWFQWWSPKGTRERYPMVEVEASVTTSDLGYVDLSDGSLVVVQSGRRRARLPWQGIQPLEWAGWLYLFDGVNPPVRWSPDHPVRPVGFYSAPGQPIVHTNDGGSTWDIYDWAGDSSQAFTTPYAQQRGLGTDTPDQRFEYGYAITVINDLGQESPPSSIVYAQGATSAEVASTGRGLRPGASVIIPRQPDHIRTVRLWRTKNLRDTTPIGRPPLYLLTEFFHAAGAEYLDFSPDEELTDLLDEEELGTMPVAPLAAAIWQQTMFVISQDGSSVQFSEPGFIEQFPARNNLPMASPRSGPLTSLHVAPRGVVVFAERAVFMIKGDPFNGYRGETLITGKGSLSGRGVFEVPGAGFAFLDPNVGPCVIVGSLDDDVATDVRPIGEELQRSWRERVNREALSQARATLDPRSREVWWHLPEGGSQDTSFGVVLHYELGAWSFREQWPIGDMDFDRGFVWFGGQTTNPGLWVITPNATTKGGVAFTTTYQTAWHTMQRRQLVSTLRLQVIGTGRGDIQVANRIDRRLTYEDQTEEGPCYAAPTEYEPATWGTDTWSTTEVWGDYIPLMLPIDMRAEVALEHQFRIQSDGATDMRLLDIQVGMTPTEADPPFERG